MVVIRSIETALPPTVIAQQQFRDLLASQPAYGRLGKRLVTAAFDASAIETRHVVLEEFAVGATTPDPAFFDATTGLVQDPGTKTRNDAYVAQSKPLLVDAARRALESAPGLTAADVTHVVTVSCTGFFAPGPDYVLVRELGLAPSTQRFHLGFMGCYGAFPALRMADQFCRADPTAVVLVVSVELCSLHLHVDDDPDSIVAASVFADGAAAAIVTADDAERASAAAEAAPAAATALGLEPTRSLESACPVLRLDAFETIVVPEGEAEMAWTIGDRGFDMTLSSYVPRIVEQNVGSALAPLLDGAPAVEVERWAIHPGGRSILDRVQTALGLSDEQLEASRGVLRDYGNMSSATVLFVLKRLLDEAAAVEGAAPEGVGAVAFGPGLTVESALMTLIPAPSHPAPADELVEDREPERETARA
ncbi:naringenin-chalcone synthase [Frondihabitans sp. PAMC 28766]|uniref:type III polyketide synthase n=1 Tax=Frondihabitans sp. PAMC 28766 TaxID=1795630 RepID=UPI00078C4E7A|nr:type III polyketide synthase [Frondihabitans sp. PAMC 28766]AMM21828.1 naringenin-chalcone synthase [Frondihabitans sp. PAMC 28766]